MTRYLPWAVLALILAGSVYAYTEVRSQRDAALRQAERKDSARMAWRDTAEAVRERMAGRLGLWRDSTRFYRAQTDSLAAEMDSLDRQFGHQMEAILATADTGDVTMPRLRELQATHIEVVGRCKAALRSCRSEVRTVENRLQVYRDSILPVVDSLSDANRRAVEAYREIADPGWLEQLATCMPETAAKLAVVGGATLVDERAGAGAGALLGLDMALGGPC